MKLVGYAIVGTVVGAGLCVLAARGAVEPTAYDQLGLFSTAFAKVRAEYVDPVPDSRLVGAAIQGMVSKLDPHSAYMDAKDFGGEFQVRTQGHFGGVGIEVSPDAGLIKVISAMDGMPAAAAGVKPQDHIIAVDGVAVEGHEFNDAIDKMRGPVGTKVTITVQRAGEKKPFDVTLTRANVPYEAATHHREGDIGYIRLPSFNEQTADGLEKAVRDLKKQIGPGIKGYVLDLRNNPGGLLDQAVQVSDDFLNGGESSPTAAAIPRHRALRRQAGDITDGKPMVVLINSGTASALGDRLRRAAGPPSRHHRRHDQLRQGLGADHHPAGRRRRRAAADHGALLHAVRPLDPGARHHPRYPGGAGRRGRLISERYSEAELLGHLAGEPVPHPRANAPVIYAAPGNKYDDFQLAYALDLMRGKMTVASVTKNAPG